MRDKSCINIVRKNNCIFSCFSEHIDVLALLYRICHIENRCLFRLFLFCILLILSIFFLCIVRLSCIFFLILLDTVFQCQIFIVNIFKQNVVMQFFRELAVFNASKFNEWTDIIPVFLIRLTICLAHSCQFIRNFLGDIL